MDLKDLLLNLKMVMFGGKGGVGKTTCAASSAIWAAEHNRKTLIISTDPAHSLGDSLGVKLPLGVPTPIKGIENLTALEINPKANMSGVKDDMNINPIENSGLGGMMKGFGMLDMQDFASINPPGIDEIIAFGEVLRLIETRHGYDLIIFDTAPTGHTLRLLCLPDALSSWIGKILKARLKLGTLFGTFKHMFSKGEKEKDKSLEILVRLKKLVDKGKADLSNPNITSFVVVLIPEEMAIAETGRLLNELVKYEISTSNIIINQLYPNGENLCEFCKKRREMQQRNLLKIKSIFGEKLGKNLIEVPLFKEEVKEYSKLKEIVRFLIS